MRLLKCMLMLLHMRMPHMHLRMPHVLMHSCMLMFMRAFMLMRVHAHVHAFLFHSTVA